MLLHPFYWVLEFFGSPWVVVYDGWVSWVYASVHFAALVLGTDVLGDVVTHIANSLCHFFLVGKHQH
jgi:hypothetical protein